MFKTDNLQVVIIKRSSRVIALDKQVQQMLVLGKVFRTRSFREIWIVIRRNHLVTIAAMNTMKPYFRICEHLDYFHLPHIIT